MKGFSVAPEGLSGDFYKGHIFWDAEVWMFPALLAQHPDLARKLLDYRFEHLAQARAQAAKQGCKGIDFPWESAASGNETAPGGFSEGAARDRRAWAGRRGSTGSRRAIKPGWRRGAGRCSRGLQSTL